MKAEIHPGYAETTITCACGNVMQVRSTGNDMHINVCSACHPFYSGGKQAYRSTDSRIAQFRKRYGESATGRDASAAKM